MKKTLTSKLLIYSSFISVVASMSLNVVATQAEKPSDIQSDIIRPLSHIRGEEINTLPLNIQEWYRRPSDSYEYLWNLYNAHPDMESNNWKTISTSEYRKKYFSEQKQAANISFNGKSFSIPIVLLDDDNFTSKVAINLIVEGNYKTKYVPGETFDSSGITIKVVYSNLTATNVTAQVVFSQKQLTLNDSSITASYGDLTVQIPIIVSDSPVNDDTLVCLTYSGSYKDYYLSGECFNRRNFIATARYADGSLKVVTDQLKWEEDDFAAIKAEKSAYMSSYLDKWDDFHQINNVLKWEVKDGVDVANYQVTVSLNPELTKVLYKAQVSEPEYKMMNMYTGCDYYWQVKVNETNGTSVKSPIYHFTVADTPRTVYIQGISNTRDVGGYDTPWGEFKQGYVYRGAHVDEVSDLGLDVFKNELGIKTDLDLRTPGNEVGRYNPLELDYYVGPVDFLSYQMLDPMIVPYDEKNPTGRAEVLRRVKTAIEPFANPDNYPIYFHCAVGRDRTGSVGAIIDGLMGRTADEIIHNYALSVFSVTGCYNLNNIKAGYANGLSLITAFNNVEGGEGKTLAEKVELLLLRAGLTQEQINSIRNILTGKDDRAKNSMKFIENNDNYSEQVVVNFKQVGDGEEQVFAPVDSIINAPFDLKEGYGWYDGEKFVDLSSPVHESMNLVAKRVEHFNVTLHYMKGEKADQVLSYNEGDIIKVTDFAINGLVPTAYLDNGTKITSIEVTRDLTINLLYR